MHHRSTICFVAGRSGGHLLPALTLAKQYSEHNILFFSTDSTLDKKILQDTTYIPLTLENVPYKKPWLLPKFCYNLTKALCKSLYYLHKNKPQKIISTGGYIAIPVCMAATLLRIPIKLHELNVIPGKALKFLAPLATTITVCFEQSKKYLPTQKCALGSYPLRFNAVHTQLTKQQACKLLGLDPHKKTLLILGGSQGSLFINTMIKQWIEHSSDLHSTIQVIHQTGAHDTTDWKTYYKSKTISALVFDYYNELATCYAAADVVVCRSGAGTLFETLFFEKLCITIPLETTTTSHQVTNAHAMAAQHQKLFTVIRQEEITNNPGVLYNALVHHLK